MTAQQKEETRHSYKRTQTIQVTNRLYDICRYLLTVTDNKDTLQRALPWIKHAVYLAARDTGYFKYVYPLYLDSYAVYLYQLDRKAEAIDTEQHAVSLIKDLSGNKVPEPFAVRLLQMKQDRPLDCSD